MFNPATFDISHLSTAAAKRAEQLDDIDHQPRVTAVHRPTEGPFVAEMAGDLKAAARYYAANEHKPFCQGKAATCLDMAGKLERFGSFVSEAQASYARKLIGWAVPSWERPVQAPSAPVAALQAPAPALTLPKLFALMQRLSKLTIGDIVIARKNQDSLLWVKIKGHESMGVVAKIEHGVLTTFHVRLGQAGTSAAAVIAELLRIEADPEAAAALHGKLSGRCSICSRDLTDPVSIERGIGPICIAKAGW